MEVPHAERPRLKTNPRTFSGNSHQMYMLLDGRRVPLTLTFRQFRLSFGSRQCRYRDATHRHRNHVVCTVSTRPTPALPMPRSVEIYPVEDKRETPMSSPPTTRLF
jgi:hypothetical protein